MMNDAPQKVFIEFVLKNYDVLLIDAFGVLMSTEGALPGAVDFIKHLNSIKKPYYILSNGSLYNAQQNQGNYARRGFTIPKEHIISSGTLIEGWIERERLKNKRFLVLAPEPTKCLVREAGGLVCEGLEENPDVLLIGDPKGQNYLDEIEHAITILLHSLDRGQALRVLVPNPDVIYPKTTSQYGITAGALALLLEKSVSLRYPTHDFKIEYLGKPYRPIFEEAFRREDNTATTRMIMIGDQLETDIKGALNVGIDSVLMGTGITKIEDITFKDGIRPTYLMDTLLSETIK
jgi:HAD superfamily hydrolase (TIGR01459 family)